MNQHFTPLSPEAVAKLIGVPVSYITASHNPTKVRAAKLEYVRQLLFHSPNMPRQKVARAISVYVDTAGQMIHGIANTMAKTAIDNACFAGLDDDVREIARAVSKEHGIAIGIIRAYRRVSAPIVAARYDLLTRVRAVKPSLTSPELADICCQDASHIRHLIREGKI
ncbi:hypothetical protein ACLB6G_20525 [Zhengella sp. ZM62]|uniref:hypothetical protein n=1 Tax=Zhengella sedimenti TaxID=3390035 RepID=UPI0039758D3A